MTEPCELTAVEARAREALLVAQAPIVTAKREVVLARQVAHGNAVQHLDSPFRWP